MRLKDKRALVTGASRGIGRAIALGLAREGASVAINYRRSRGDAESAVREIERMGRRAVAVQGSTDSRSDVERFIAEAHDFLGGLDVLVNNAGILKRTPFLEIDEEEWDAILAVNLKGYFLVGQAVARRMVAAGTPGAVVNVSSAGQAVAGPNLAHYCVSKAGVEMLTKEMALELASHNIRVNAVAPGLIETDINRSDIAQDSFREGRLARIPLRLIGAPDDVVGAVVFLAANDEARLMTGASVFVDGGQTIW
ncbi:MAG: 3-oxoacyl-ACP reductase FabG [Gemmatimonadetes bacterium]|nr:3-oxoacyl-ACP reductase FabG [Gemmatimonadota bacterium]